MKASSSLAALTLACLGLMLCARNAEAQVEFGGLDLGADDRLLFSARTTLPGGGVYDSLFSADLGTGRIAQLTIYPERICLVDGGRRLQVQNRFGLWRTDRNLADIAPVLGYPSFAEGRPLREGRLAPSEPSPDGAYVLSLEPDSPAYARMMLLDVARNARTLVADKIEYSVGELPARWSPDSRRLVYAKAGSVYYYSVDQLFETRLLDESYRRIGEGRILSIRWAQDGSLFYLRGSSLFRILPGELYTQAFYQGIAGMGSLVGKTPLPFDPNFDNFWLARDGSRIILAKGGRNLFLLYLDPDDYSAEARISALPYLFLQGDTAVRDLFWPANGEVTVFTGSLRGGARSSGAYRFAAPREAALVGLAPNVRFLEAADALELALSPDGSKIAIIKSDSLLVRSYADWSLKAEIKAPGIVHALWVSEDRLVLAGSSRIETLSLSSGERRLVALSQVERYGRSAEGALMATSLGATYSRPALSTEESFAAARWEKAGAFAVLDPATSSDKKRVYVDELAAGSYKNIVMVREARSLGTKPLFAASAIAYAPFPPREEPSADGVFNHGSRIRRREVALAFNAMDSAEGLIDLLQVLDDYRIRANFFINGEFVRQSPGASRLLAASGHEIGSMFFSPVDPSDIRFRADGEYIRRGLARAEDEWFAATGKELSLLWHTPFYTLNSDIVAAGASMNYIFAGRDIDPLDWVGRTEAVRLPGSYLPTHVIIERIVKQVKPGSIIPIRLGVPEGGRDDYLYREIALLIDALAQSGYSVVPIADLIEHAK